MTEFLEHEYTPNIRIISGPEMIGPDKNIEKTLFGYKIATVERTRYSKGGVDWQVAFTKDLPRINQGGPVKDLPPNIYINADGTLRLNGGFGFKTPEVKNLFQLGIDFLREMGIELPKSDPRFSRLEALILKYLQEPYPLEEVLKKGDCVAEWNPNLEDFLVNVGEINHYGVSSRSRDINLITAARGEQADVKSIRFKRPLLFIAFHHFTPDEQHITCVYNKNDPEILVHYTGENPATISKIDKKIFENIKREARPFAQKE